MHLRSGDEREWKSFPQVADGPSIALTFEGLLSKDEFALVLRQRDVKAVWTVSINGSDLGTLIQDERHMVRILPVPAGVLRQGENQLRIASKPGTFSDDIEISEVRLQHLSARQLQTQATVDVSAVVENGEMPVRITVVDGDGYLVPVTPLRENAYEAVRTGVIYTADGRASVGLPAGAYRIYASRGFEYSAPSKAVRVTRGARTSVTLNVRHEVKMNGFVSCDTHVHTLELSGHGDASVDERILTAAGEGLDWIVATEHNRHTDYSAAIRRRGLDRWIASIPGTEVTTAIGHFNIFPMRDGVRHPDIRQKNWAALMKSMKEAQGVRVVVQNHPRDLHSGYRPFDPAHHDSATGENKIGRPFAATAMEVVNSGAMSSDPLQLVRDWLGLLTRGRTVAAIGASDTHTVDFVPIGQARTYIESANDADRLAEHLAAGRNVVSYGLAAELKQAGPVTGGTVPLEVTVWGPSWSRAREVTVFSGVTPVWTKRLRGGNKGGRKFAARIKVPGPTRRSALVAVATGPGLMQPFWEVRKPYQPTSDEWNPIVLGISQAVWIGLPQ